MIKLVAFDLDGTIGDTILFCIEAFAKAVSPYTGKQLTDEEIVQTFGLNEEGMVRKMVSGEDVGKALEAFYSEYKGMHALCPSPFDGMRELINALKTRGIIVALVTGKGETSCAITLEQFGMEDLFARIETGSPDKNRKAEAFFDLIAAYEVVPDEMIYVGDAISDVAACREAGIPCLSAAWATGVNKDKLEECNSGFVFATVEALSHYLLQERI